MPTMERILISEWEQQAAYSSHTTRTNATHPATAALDDMKNDDNDNIAPTVSECRSDIDYPTTSQPAADDKQQRPNDTSSSSAAACPAANNTSRSTNTTSSYDDDEEDSDEEIGTMIYASSNTARARRAADGAASAVTSDQSSSSYEPCSEVRKSKREISSDISSKEMESAPKKKRIFKSFEQRIADLKAYKAKHGHIKVKRSEDKSLYQFCWNMRQARNNPEKSNKLINDDRVASLDAFGFDWSMNRTNSDTKSFAQRTAELRAYKEKHGHVNVKPSEDKSLYKFCYNVRYTRINPEKSNVTLTMDRIASLDALVFDWSVTERGAKKSFKQRMDELRAYKAKHGHTNVKKSEDKSLHNICSKLRQARQHPEKCTTLINEERIASLDALGFDWSMNSTNIKSFEQRIADLKAYKEKHGHVNVKWSQDQSLYDFCRNIRNARNNPEKSTMTLTDDRIASLNALGFEWAVIERRTIKSFEQRIEGLQAYKEKHGHVNVKKSEDKSLYEFCKSIRYGRINPEKTTRALTDERIASLNALGFEWAVIERRAIKSFEQRIEDLRAYKEKNGHVNVKGSDDKILYGFCYNVRYARNNPGKSDTLINEKRIASLDALGFDWRATAEAASVMNDSNQSPTSYELRSEVRSKREISSDVSSKEMKRAPKKKRVTKSFEQRIKDLKAYKEKHGHVNVKKKDDKSLYEFCVKIKCARSNPENSLLIKDGRIASLDALGFDWSTEAQRIEDLKAYKEKRFAQRMDDLNSLCCK